MTYREIERYVDFYSNIYTERVRAMMINFSICNAESVYHGAAAVMNKNGASILERYRKNVVRRFSKEETSQEDNFEYLENQFN